MNDLIELALWSPSPHNAQPWRFTHVRGSDKAELASVMGEALRADLVSKSADLTSIEDQVERSKTRISRAPYALLCSVVIDGLRMVGNAAQDRLELQMAVQSVGAVLQTFFLLAWEQGLGTCWMAAPMYCPDVVRGVLRLPPAHLPQALVLLGYPVDPRPPPTRLSITDVVRPR